MFEPGEKVSIIGTFILSAIAEEGFLEFDPFERGQIEMNNEQNSSELIEVTASGKEKEFDDLTSVIFLYCPERSR